MHLKLTIILPILSLVALTSCGSKEFSGIPDTPEQRNRQAITQASLTSLASSTSKESADKILHKLEQEDSESIIFQVEKAKKYIHLWILHKDQETLNLGYKIIKKLHKHTSSYPELYYLEVLYIQYTDEFADTEPLLRTLLEHNPYHLDGHLNLAQVLVNKADMSSASEQIQITQSLLDKAILSESEKYEYLAQIQHLTSLSNR